LNIIFLNDEQEQVNSISIEIPINFKKNIGERDMNLKIENFLTNHCKTMQKHQRAAHSAHNILKALVEGELDKMSGKELDKFYKNNYLNYNYSIEEIKIAYENALNLHRLAVAKTYSIPGPKMIFQGDESANMSYFKFFRKISTGYEKELEAKGYAPTIKAFLDSKLYSINYTGKYKDDMEFTERFTHDLNDLADENFALQSGKIISTISHECSYVHAIHCKSDCNEIFSIANFYNICYQKNYSIPFPMGKWKEVFNSNDKNYGKNGKFLNEDIIDTDISPCSCISLPSFGVIFFKKII